MRQAWLAFILRVTTHKDINPSTTHYRRITVPFHACLFDSCTHKSQQMYNVLHVQGNMYGPTWHPISMNKKSRVDINVLAFQNLEIELVQTSCKYKYGKVKLLINIWSSGVFFTKGMNSKLRIRNVWLE